MGDEIPEWQVMWGAKVKMPADMPDDMLKDAINTSKEASMRARTSKPTVRRVGHQHREYMRGRLRRAVQVVRWYSSERGWAGLGQGGQGSR